MSKLLKSKIFLGFMIVTALFVGVGALTASASYTHTGLLKMGMTGSQVMSLQMTLNSNGFLVATVGAGSPGMESTFFGAKTKAAVMAFQSAHGLTADGVVGVNTGTALAALTGGSVSYPAGCTSTSGYSSTTGMPCTSTGNLPAGCMSTMGYSSTTGAKCDGSTTGGSSTGGALQGGAGSVQSYKLLGSPSNNQDVGEDQSDVKVLGFSVQADQSSDLNVKSVKLALGSVPTASGVSTRFEDYADTITIWYGSTQVAEADAADFNDDSSNNYTKTISFTRDAIVRAGDTGEFYVAVSGARSIDSGDLNQDWSVDVSQVRFVDAQGAVVTEDPSLSARTFVFKSFSSANNVELRLSESSSNPDAGVVKADDTNSTDNVLLLKGTLKAVGSDIKVRSVKAVVTPAGTGDASEIASQFTLKIDGQTIESVDSAACTVAGDCDGTGTATAVTYLFNDNDITINEGDSVTIELLADINDVDASTFVAGDSLSASITATTTYIGARDATNNDLTNSELTGSLNGNAQTFFTKGIAVTPGSMSAEATSQVSANSGTYTIKFSVTAIDEDVYLDKTFASSTSTSTTPAGSSRVAVTNSAGTVRASGFSAALSSSDNNSSEKTNTFKIADGQTASFTLTVNETGHSEQNRAVLYGLEWGTSDAATGSSVYTSNMGVDGDYKTAYIYVGA